MAHAVVYPAGRGEWSAGDRVIAHIDMDAFFASVEILDFPELKGKPVVVGGASNRGVVAAASYRAREFGIHSAMPIFQARRLCPGLVIQPGRMKRYSELSGRIMKVLYSYSPLVEQISIDEAYIDLTGTEKLFGKPAECVSAIKTGISADTSLTASVGLSSGKLPAKIASDFNKPDGITIVPPGRVQDFLDSLPIGRIPGVGKKSEEQLRKIGVKKLGDLRTISSRLIEERFGKGGERLLEIADGSTGSPVQPYSRPKSVSNEITLGEDTEDIETLEKHLMALSEKVGRRLRKNSMCGRTVTLKLKDSDHRLITRSVTLDRPTQQGKAIFTEARALLRSNRSPGMKRLIGVGVSNLEDTGSRGQMNLFAEKDPDEAKWDRVETAVDDILDRFGQGAVKKGRLSE